METLQMMLNIIYAEAYFSVKPILLKCRIVTVHMTLFFKIVLYTENSSYYCSRQIVALFFY